MRAAHCDGQASYECGDYQGHGPRGEVTPLTLTLP